MDRTLKYDTINLLLDEIADAKDWIDLSQYIDNWSDLAFKLLESYNIDGSITYNTYQSQETLKDHFEGVGEYIEEINDNWCIEVKPFQEPEKALVQIVLYIASGLNVEIDSDTTWEDVIDCLKGFK